MDVTPIWLRDTTSKDLPRDVREAAEQGNVQAVRTALHSGRCHINSVRFNSIFSSYARGFNYQNF